MSAEIFLILLAHTRDLLVAWGTRDDARNYGSRHKSRGYCRKVSPCRSRTGSDCFAGCIDSSETTETDEDEKDDDDDDDNLTS